MDNPPPLAVNTIFEIPYFKLARNEAKKSSYRIQVGAVLVNKKPIVKGFNKLKTHPRFANPESYIKLSVHAEIDCLRQMKFQDTDRLSIYVYRESDGKPAMSRPCKDCMNELKLAGIRKIFYSVPIWPFWKMEVL